MRFECEADVRKEVRVAFPSAQWVEAALGGSTGLPDCFINDVDGMPSRVVFFELKVGTLAGSILTYKIRPAQRKRIKAMLGFGYCVWLLVGEKGGDCLWRIFPGEGERRGKAMVSRDEDLAGAVRIFDVRSELLAGSFLGGGFRSGEGETGARVDGRPWVRRG